MRKRRGSADEGGVADRSQLIPSGAFVPRVSDRGTKHVILPSREGSRLVRLGDIVSERVGDFAGIRNALDEKIAFPANRTFCRQLGTNFVRGTRRGAPPKGRARSNDGYIKVHKGRKAMLGRFVIAGLTATILALSPIAFATILSWQTAVREHPDEYAL